MPCVKFPGCILCICVFISSVTFYDSDTSIWLCVNTVFLCFVGVFRGSYVPVSYTHLDVYKRQDMSHMRNILQLPSQYDNEINIRVITQLLVNLILTMIFP